MNLKSLKSLLNHDFVIILIIVLIIGIFSFPGFRDSLMRARDAQRKNDIGVFVTALKKYNEDFGFYPLSTIDGKIVACNPVTKQNDRFVFSPCKSGEALRDLGDLSYPAYMPSIPGDPQSPQGVTYFYVSDGKYFQIYASLEEKKQDEFNPKIVKRNLKCGTRICNFGQSDGKTPLDKSLEEYENEINAQSKSK